MLRSSCLVFMLVAIAAADVQTGVVRSGGRAIPGATITATCGSDRISTVTDSAGRFEIGGLPAKASCNFSVAMFGFEPIERQSVTSAAPLNFDLKLQARATLPQQPQNKPNSPLPAPAQAQSTPGPGRGGFGPGRGGQFARRNPNGQTPSGGGRGGFQNLSLIGNGEPAEDGQIEPVPGTTDANAGNASEAFVLNGSLSEGVQTQPGDGLGWVAREDSAPVASALPALAPADRTPSSGKPRQAARRARAVVAQVDSGEEGSAVAVVVDSAVAVVVDSVAAEVAVEVASPVATPSSATGSIAGADAPSRAAHITHSEIPC